MAKSGRPPDETEPHTVKFKVRDFRKKLWLLILLHEAMHLKLRNLKGLRGSYEDDLPIDEGRMTWFETSLLKPNADKLIWASGWPTSGNIPCPTNVTYEALPQIAVLSWDEMTQNVRKFASAIQHSVLNARIGFHLKSGGVFSNQTRHNPNSSNTTQLERILKENLLPDDERIGVRILSRLAFGFFMAPQTEFPKGKIPEHYDAPLRFAESRHPRGWDCFGAGETWLEREGVTPKVGRDGLTWQDLDEWKARQRLAVAVLRGFFCKPYGPSGGRGDVYGGSADEFLQAVQAYYLQPSLQINDYQPPPLFKKHAPSASRGGAKGGAGQALTMPIYEATGEGENPLAAVLHMRFNLETENVLLHGNFHPPPHDAGEVVFTDMRVSLKLDSESGPAAVSLDYEATQALPNGCSPFGFYGIRISASQTEDVNSILSTGVPVMRIRGACAPFDVLYDLVAPLASIKLAAHAEETAVNTPPPTPCRILAEYLRAKLAPGQTNWAPPQMIELVRNGVFRISDEHNNLRRRSP